MASVSAKSNLAGIASRLHSAAADVPRQLNSASIRTVSQLQTKLKGSALSTLPRRGGLNRAVAFDLRFSTRPLGNGARLEARSQYDIVRMDVGETVHPLFGDRRFWYTEAIKPGWWSKVIDSVQPDGQRNFEQALNTIAKEAGG